MANQKISNFAATWNNAGTTFHGIKLNVTNTASAADSNFITMQIGGVDFFEVTKAGAIIAASSITSGGAVLLAANDGGALGASGTAFSDLFLASGGVVNWNAGDVTITHSANTLAFAGASSGYTFDAGLTITSTDAGATVGPSIDLYRDSASPAANDVLGAITFSGEDAGGNKTEYAAIEAILIDTTGGSEDGVLNFRTMKAGTSANILTLNPNAVTFTPASTFSVINTDSDANAFVFMGGNTGSTGGQVIAYGQSHATDANDVAFFSGGSSKMRYDASDGAWEVPAATPFDHGTFSTTGASAGTKITGALLTSSSTGTALTTHQAYYNANGNVGGVATSGTGTIFAESSDQRLKKNFRALAAQGDIIDSIRMYEFDWIGGGTGIGPKAQEIYEVFPGSVVPGRGEPGDADFRPWMWGASRLIPVVIKELQDLRKRVAVVEAIRR